MPYLRPTLILVHCAGCKILPCSLAPSGEDERDSAEYFLCFCAADLTAIKKREIIFQILKSIAV